MDYFTRAIQERALMKLQQLNAAGDLRDLSIPGSNQLEALKGERKGEHSIRINQQWRICFKWRNGHALEVEIVERALGQSPSKLPMIPPTVAAPATFPRVPPPSEPPPGK
jgi:proteic killer suppression protein